MVAAMQRLGAVENSIAATPAVMSQEIALKLRMVTAGESFQRMEAALIASAARDAERLAGLAIHI